MDIKSVNSGNGRLEQVQNDKLQNKRLDEQRVQNNAVNQKQIQDKLELSTEATLKNSSAKTYSAGNMNNSSRIEQKLKQYDRPEVYREVAKKLNGYLPVERKA